MRSKYILLFTVPLILLTALMTSGTVLAAPIEVNVPGDYPSIQTAIDYAATQFSLHPENSYSVLVEPSSTSYSVPAGGIVLKSNIPVRGRETARTIIDGGGSGTAVTANNVTGVSFKNFTVINADIGIHVSGNSSVTITNNVFQVGTASTAVMIQSFSFSGSSPVTNNTFYQNGTAISRDTDSFEIKNNIFYNSSDTVKISQTGALTETNISYNLFYPDVNGPKGTGYIPSLTITNPDPMFVDPTQDDFHIESNPTSTSPCIDQGNTAITDSIDGTPSDIGAYGGTTQDTIPFIVSGVTATLASADSISVNWSANTSYVVNDVNHLDNVTTGGYNLYYSLDQSGAPYQNKITLASTATSTVISGLTTTAAPPAAPVVNPPGFDTQTLKLSWSAVPGATGYYVYYLATGTTNTQKTDIIHATNYDLGGLINLTDYTIWVTAYAQPAYYFAVTAFDYTPGTHIPGTAHESAYSPETVYNIGSASESPLSDPVFGYPEAIEYSPNLPNKGCFIATAAYGHYDAPHVQALRDFRDRYLETNSAGRVFVRWYYEYGPIGAAALNEHPWLKPVVRTMLLPAVGGAIFLTRTSTVTKLLVLFLFSFMIAVLVLYKKIAVRGGSR